MHTGVTVYYWAPGYIRTTAVGDTFTQSSILYATLAAFFANLYGDKVRMSPGHMAIGVSSIYGDSQYLSISYDCHQGKTRNLVYSALTSLPINIIDTYEEDAEMFSPQVCEKFTIQYADNRKAKSYIKRFKKNTKTLTENTPYFNLLSGSHFAPSGSNCSSLVIDVLIESTTDEDKYCLQQFRHGISSVTPQNAFNFLRDNSSDTNAAYTPNSAVKHCI